MATKAQLDTRDASTAHASEDSALCQSVCEQQQRRLYRLCHWMVHDEEEARALATSVLLQALRKATTYRVEPDGTSPEELGDLLVRQLTLRFRTAFLQPEEMTAAALPGQLRFLDPNHARAALQTLRPAARLLYLLHDLEGYPLETIAGWVELEPAHCARRIHSARIDLRNMLLMAA